MSQLTLSKSLLFIYQSFHSAGQSQYLIHCSSCSTQILTSFKQTILKMASQIQKPSPQCQTAVIISGFACIGKSQLSKSQATKSTPKGFYKGYKVVDLDSAGYTVDPITKEKRSSAEFVKHYIAAILPYRSQKVILMMSTHPESKPNQSPLFSSILVSY